MRTDLIKRRKINAIDIVIIILFLALVLGFIARAQFVRDFIDNLEETEITVLVEVPLNSSQLRMLNVDDEVMLCENSDYFGRVVDIDTDYDKTVIVDNGESKVLCYKSNITLSVSANLTESGYKVGRIYFSPAEELTLKTLDMSFDALVLSIISQ